MSSTATPTGELGLTVLRRPDPTVIPAPLAWKIRNLPNRMRGTHRRLLARTFRIATFEGSLSLRLFRADGTIIDYGCVSKRVVTTTGVTFIADDLRGTEDISTLHFHGFGTGGSAEAVGNTALTTELTTEYVSDNTRPTGTQAGTAGVFTTVATLDPDSAVAITEHGIFDQAANSGGTLLDRTLFSVINVAAAGDTLEATYSLTLTAGS